MPTVFKDVDGVFRLLGRLVRRPAKGEAPEGVKGRNGIPVVCLQGGSPVELSAALALAMRKARPNGILHESVDLPALWSEVAGRPPESPDALPADWQPVEFYRRVLVQLAQEYSSASNDRDRRVRFRRFGLVNWLVSAKYAAEEPDPQHDRDLLRGLRDREFLRRRLFGVLRSPETEVALQGGGQVAWWVQLFGLHVFPVVWFRAWRGMGVEYRWLLRQPYMAPRDPGTFVGFAMRLTQPRWGREDPEQVGKLMINAFLEDLRAEYRRRSFRRRRAARRTAYCVALLLGASEENHGKSLLRSLIDVRNDTGAFDPLVVISSTPNGDGQAGGGQLSEDLYGIWRSKFSEAGRSRTPEVWYLPVTVPEPLSEGDADFELHRDRLRLADQLEITRPPRWARRGVSAVAAVLALALTGGCLAWWTQSEVAWQEQHCGLSRSHPDAPTLTLASTDECVGVAPHGYAFGSSDAKVRETLAVIAEQNEEADRLNRESKRPLMTLAHVSALLSTEQASNDGPLTYAREQLQGVASAQRRQLDKRGVREPALRIYPASAGSQMRFGPEVVKTLKGMMRRDESIVGVTGLDQSRKKTVATIESLTEIGLPMVATTLSADSFSETSPLYYQVSPQNQREAAVAAAYASRLVVEEDRKKQVRVLYSDDPSDLYSSNLRADVAGSMRKAGFDVEEAGFTPGDRLAGPRGSGPRSVGERACSYEGIVFYAGRAEDFATVLNGADEACGSAPPTFLGGDDVARLAADPDLRSAHPKVPFTFLDFTLGSASCSDSNLYATMQKLFPDECKQAPNTSLDGHATLAFDAVNLFVKARGQLRDAAAEFTPNAVAVWHALSSIHGNAALDGESGRIDFGGKVDRQVPVEKLISVQRVDGKETPRQVGFCGRVGQKEQDDWCPGEA